MFIFIHIASVLRIFSMTVCAVMLIISTQHQVLAEENGISGRGKSSDAAIKTAASGQNNDSKSKKIKVAAAQILTDVVDIRTK